MSNSKADSLLVGALVGLFIFVATGAVRVLEADEVFTAGMRMMALIGFIMLTAQGFASVMNATDRIGPTAGLGADGQHDHIRDTVIPTFLHFNLPLLAAGWVAAMVL